MADIYVSPIVASPNTGTNRNVRLNSTAYALGDRVVNASTINYFVFECTTAGTSAATAPTYVTTPGSTTTDGTVVWTCRLPTSWTNATISLNRGMSGAVYGDNVYVDNTITDNYVASTSFATASGPVKVMSVTSGSSPVTYARGARIQSTNASNLAFNSTIYIAGLDMYAGNAASVSADVVFVGAVAATGTSQRIEDCYIDVGNGTSADITFGEATSTAPIVVDFYNCTFRIRNTAANFILLSTVNMYGCNLDPAGALTAQLLVLAAARRSYLFNAISCDFSQLATTATLVTTAAAFYSVIFDKCKFPASFTGLIQNPRYPTGRISLYECEFGTTRQILWIDDYSGTIKSDTGIYRSGGASDGVTSLSHRMETLFTSNNTTQALITDWIGVPVMSTGSKTFTMEMVHDSATALNDSQIWIEVAYFGTSSSVLGSYTSDRVSNLLATPTTYTSSSATWVGTGGFANPNKQKMSVTVTVNNTGVVYVRAVLGLASKVVYICPKVDVT